MPLILMFLMVLATMLFTVNSEDDLQFGMFALLTLITLIVFLVMCISWR